MVVMEYRPIRYPGADKPPTVEEIERHIMTTDRRTVSVEAARRVLSASQSRVRELEERIHQMNERRLISEARRSKGGVAK